MKYNPYYSLLKAFSKKFRQLLVYRQNAAFTMNTEKVDYINKQIKLLLKEYAKKFKCLKND